nr:hypothetical protein Iba_chr14bCG0460 [Ipomoea batatas]
MGVGSSLSGGNCLFVLQVDRRSEIDGGQLLIEDHLTIRGLHLRNTPEGNPIFTLRHADSPFVIKRGIRPRGISIGTSPLDFAHRRSKHSPRAMGKDVDRSP